MPDEPIINPSALPADKPAESPAPVDVSPPTPVSPTETSTSAKATGDVPPVITPEPIAPAPAAPVVPPSSDGASRPTSEPRPAPSNDGVRSLLSKALAKIQFRKRAKLEKIMVLAKSKGQITNDDAQKLLRISDATATRYLSELVKTGRLRRAGIRGGAVYHFVQ